MLARDFLIPQHGWNNKSHYCRSFESHSSGTYRIEVCHIIYHIKGLLKMRFSSSISRTPLRKRKQDQEIRSKKLDPKHQIFFFVIECNYMWPINMYRFEEIKNVKSGVNIYLCIKYIRVGRVTTYFHFWPKTKCAPFLLISLSHTSRQQQENFPDI